MKTYQSLTALQCRQIFDGRVSATLHQSGLLCRRTDGSPRSGRVLTPEKDSLLLHAVQCLLYSYAGPGRNEFMKKCFKRLLQFLRTSLDHLYVMPCERFGVGYRAGSNERFSHDAFFPAEARGFEQVEHFHADPLLVHASFIYDRYIELSEILDVFSSQFKDLALEGG